jgi:5-(carboxyamino)imidazole ribonucleotide synthase
MIPPGSTIGIVGGGQLGRMLAIAAAQLGYKCQIFAPDEESPAADVAAGFTRASYDDVDALRRFADAVDVVTYEFENLCAESLAAIRHRLRPGVASLQISQDRALEKGFVGDNGGRVAAWREVGSEEEARAAERELGLPLIFKTRRFGYDGKGQARAAEPGSAVAAWDAIGRAPAIAERMVAFEAEFSVLLARTEDARLAVWDVPLNLHQGGILRRSTVPAGDAVERQADEAIRVATGIAEALDHVGLLTVEFFACPDGPLVNEIAPRVHNSGHWTIEGSLTSQFEQHIRAICGLPLGDTRRTAPQVRMDNLIGDEAGGWADLLADPSAHLHLYGKSEPRPGRKMGHVTRLLF